MTQYELAGIEVEDLRMLRPGDYFPSEVWAAMGEDPIEAAHEAHGGDESPDPENCPVCFQALDVFLRYGYMR